MAKFTPHPYQQECINAVIEKPGVALWLEMGLGKTVVTLTAITALIQLGEVNKVLIVAPKKVAEATWQDEAKKWEHLQGLRLSTVLGTAMQREYALSKRADIYITNGAMYDEEKQVHQLNHCKLDAFMELIDALDGQKALVFYGFDFDRELLQSELKTRERSLRFAVLAGREEADAWNRGELDILLAQPASCAYGLNLQAGGHHLIWYSLPWSLELYEQGNARLYRQGQQHPVIIHRLLVKNGADELVARSLESKSACQQGLIQGIKALAEEAHNGQ